MYVEVETCSCYSEVGWDFSKSFQDEQPFQHTDTIWACGRQKSFCLIMPSFFAVYAIWLSFKPLCQVFNCYSIQKDVFKLNSQNEIIQVRTPVPLAFRAWGCILKTFHMIIRTAYFIMLGFLVTKVLQITNDRQPILVWNTFIIKRLMNIRIIKVVIIAYAGGESSSNHTEWLKESTLSSESLTLMEYIEQYLVSLGSR